MRQIVTAVMLVAVFVFASCELVQMPGGTPLPGEEYELPPDVVNDVLRTGVFTYESYLSVSLSVYVIGPATARAASQESVMVEFIGSDGTSYFQGAAEPGETVEADILVPGDLESGTLVLESSAHENREILIEQPAQFAEINRGVQVEPAANVVPLADSDGDGIDDIYDAFPQDPDLAFVRTVPASGELTIAFEDNFPNIGDGDFNDFVATYQVTEYRSSKNKLVIVEGYARAIARGAGFDHEFGIVVDNGQNPRSVEIRSYDSDGNLLGTQEPTAANPAVVVLFDRTKDAFDRAGGVSMDNARTGDPVARGHLTEFTITYSKAVSTTPSNVFTPYNPYLKVLTSSVVAYQPDIHLVGRDPLPDSENEAGYEDFRHPVSGTPWALLVPNSWQWPEEQASISDAYPEFDLWVSSLGATSSDWYLSPDPNFVVDR